LNVKKTWLAPEDTVFSRISHSVSRRRWPWMTRRDRRRQP